MLVKVQAIINFTYKNYDKIKDLENAGEIEQGKIFQDDIFCVDDKEALYLTGENKDKIVAVKVLKVIPEQKPKRKTKKKEE